MVFSKGTSKRADEVSASPCDLYDASEFEEHRCLSSEEVDPEVENGDAVRVDELAVRLRRSRRD